MNNPKWARKYFTIFAGQAASLFGSGLVQFALVWYLTQQTGSATVLATATLVAILPGTLLSPLAGALADRWDRRRIMIYADSSIALATVGLAALFWTGRVEIWHIYLILALRAAGSAFHFSAMNASTTMLVPSDQLQRISGVNESLRAAINIGAPPAGALLIGLLPLQGVLFIDVATAFMAIAPLLFYSIPQPERELDESGKHKTSVMQDMKEGLDYIRAWPGLMAVCGMALIVNFLLTPTGALMPLLVTKHFGLGPLQFGLMDSVWAAGMVIGGITLGVWGGFKKKIHTAMMGVAGIGLGIMLVGFTPSTMFWMAVASVTLSGLMNPLTNGPLIAILQAEVKPEFQGRVMGVLMSLVTLMTPVGLLIAGPVSDAFGIRTWYWLTGIICLLLGLGSFLAPVIMNIENQRSGQSEDPEVPALQVAAD